MRVTIDLMKKSTQIIDLSNVINPRVGDDDLLLPLHICYGDNLYDMRENDVEFLTQDTNKNNIYIAGTCNTNTPGDNLYMGDLTFRFPAGTFKVDGTYDPDQTMFRIVDNATQKIISSVNVKITVMTNAIEFNFDPNQSSYDSRAETMLQDFHDKGQAMLDEITDLNNQAKSNVSGDTATTAEQAKEQASKNADDIAGLQGEVAGARGRFADLPGREDAQDTAISQKETIFNANANYAALQQKDAQQDAAIAQKAGKFELEDKLSQMDLQPEGFENEAALKAKYPNGKSGIMVTVDTGHKYIWANSTWTDAGIYQAVGIAENGLDLTKISFDAARLIGWDENAIGISPTGIQAPGTPITITFNDRYTWTLSGTMVTYLSSGTVKKTIPDGYVLYLDLTKVTDVNVLTTDSYIIAKPSDMPQRWSNLLLALNFSGRLLSPVQALQNKLSRMYYRPVPVSSILFYAPDNQDPIKIEDHTGSGATITFNAKTVIYSNNCSRYAYFDADMSFDLADGQSLILSWLDAPDGDPQGKLLTAGDFTVEKALDIASDYKHHLLLTYFGKKLVSHNVSLQIVIDNYYRKSMISIDNNNVITVGQGNEYATIQAAVNAAADSKDNPITILIMPGIYNESVDVEGQRHLSLIGVNKKTCIVRNDTGDYNNAPLKIEGDVMVKNLTFISTHDATTNVPVDSLRSYAVHADFDGAGTAEFIDCDMISMQNAAFGCGLHQDQTVKLIRCNLFSHTPTESSMLINGSLYCHSAVAANTSDQHLIIDDCHVESDLSWATYINDANLTNGDKTGTDMDVASYNSLFYSHEKGKTGVIHKDSGNGFSGTIKLNPMSYGNNLPELNV